jgi:hypothetical protein
VRHLVLLHVALQAESFVSQLGKNRVQRFCLFLVLGGGKWKDRARTNRFQIEIFA